MNQITFLSLSNLFQQKLKTYFLFFGHIESSADVNISLLKTTFKTKNFLVKSFEPNCVLTRSINLWLKTVGSHLKTRLNYCRQL